MSWLTINTNQSINYYLKLNSYPHSWKILAGLVKFPNYCYFLLLPSSISKKYLGRQWAVNSLSTWQLFSFGYVGHEQLFFDNLWKLMWCANSVKWHCISANETKGPGHLKWTFIDWKGWCCLPYICLFVCLVGWLFLWYVNPCWVVWQWSQIFFKELYNFKKLIIK